MMQKTFVFKREVSVTRLRGYIPAAHLNIGEELKAQMLRKGYLVKNLVVHETVTAYCIVARANVKRSERDRLQKNLDTEKR